MSQEQDNDARFALFIVFALIAAIVVGVLWFGASTVLRGNAPQPAALVTTQPSPEPIHVPGQLVAPFLVTDGEIARFFFAPGASEAIADADVQAQLGASLARLQSGAVGLIVPFGGTQPQTSVDAGLAEQRAHAVRDALVRLGVPAAQLTVAALQVDPVATDATHAQRVELVVANGALPQEQAAASASDAGAADGPRLLVQDGVVHFYFAVGSAELAAGASDALLDVMAAVASGRRAVIVGYTDPTGDAALNEQLARDRAFAVRDTLTSLGVPQERITLERPANHTGTGSLAEARRVEVHLAD